MTNIRQLRDRLEADVSDIVGVPAYAVFADETEFKPFGWFVALYHSQMHKWTQDAIGQRWRGNGPATIIDGRYLAKVNPAILDDTLAGIVIHEMGHAIDGGLHCPDVIDGLKIQFVRTSLFADHIATAEDNPNGRTERYGHEWPWIRATLHLHHRMTARGWNVPLPFAIDQSTYGISPAIAYRRALGTELDDLADVPLTEIANVEPPVAFVERYESDLATWPEI